MDDETDVEKLHRNVILREVVSASVQPRENGLETGSTSTESPVEGEQSTHVPNDATLGSDSDFADTHGEDLNHRVEFMELVTEITEESAVMTSSFGSNITEVSQVLPEGPIEEAKVGNLDSVDANMNEDSVGQIQPNFQVDGNTHSFAEFPMDSYDECCLNVEEDMDEEAVSLYFGRKMKALETENIFESKVNKTSCEVFLSASTSKVKRNDEKAMIQSQATGTIVLSAVDEMFSQLQRLARHPKREQKLSNGIFIFLLGFVGHVTFKTQEMKRRIELGEQVELDDVNETFWTKWILSNFNDQKMLRITKNKNHDHRQTLLQSCDLQSRNIFSRWEYPTEEQHSAKRIKQELLPAELVLNFVEKNSIPSEIYLNKMFRRFGPLLESDTYIDHDSRRAKVIFKRSSDAEVARNSAEKFKLLGSSVISYHIGYSPVTTVKVAAFNKQNGTLAQ